MFLNMHNFYLSKMTWLIKGNKNLISFLTLKAITINNVINHVCLFFITVEQIFIF